MASFVYPNARKLAWTGSLDLESASLVAVLLRGSTTADEDEDAVVVSDFATLAEFDGSGYARQALTGAVVDVIGSDLVLDLDDVDFGNLAGGTEPISAVLLIVDNGGPGTDTPLAYLDEVPATSIALPFDPLGHPFRIVWKPEGVLRL